MSENPVQMKKKLLAVLNEQKAVTAYDKKSGNLSVCIKAVNTEDIERNSRIGYLSGGSKTKIVREPIKNNVNNITITNAGGSVLGNLPKDICDLLSPLMDSGIATIKSSKVNKVEKASKNTMYVDIDITLIKTEEEQGGEKSILCLVGGDQVNTWSQELRIFKCDIPLDDAILLFELYNRFHGEYDKIKSGTVDDSLIGLDNLESETKVAHSLMKEQIEENLDYSSDRKGASDFGGYVEIMAVQDSARYGGMDKYVDKIRFDYDESGILTIFKKRSFDVKSYHWINQTRVSDSEWNKESASGFDNWCEIIELYPFEKNLPFDLNDEDIVSIFGFGKFKAFANISV